jgi:hypothetical protein
VESFRIDASSPVFIIMMQERGESWTDNVARTIGFRNVHKILGSKPGVKDMS